jgi:hypothetical protein
MSHCPPALEVQTELNNIAKEIKNEQEKCREYYMDSATPDPNIKKTLVTNAEMCESRIQALNVRYSTLLKYQKTQQDACDIRNKAFIEKLNIPYTKAVGVFTYERPNILLNSNADIMKAWQEYNNKTRRGGSFQSRKHNKSRHKKGRKGKHSRKFRGRRR